MTLGELTAFIRDIWGNTKVTADTKIEVGINPGQTVYGLSMPEGPNSKRICFLVTKEDVISEVSEADRIVTSQTFDDAECQA